MKTKSKPKTKYAFRVGDVARLLATEDLLQSWGIEGTHAKELLARITVTLGCDVLKGSHSEATISPGGWYVPAKYLRKVKAKVSRG